MYNFSLKNIIYLKFFKSLPSKILLFIGFFSTLLSIKFKDNSKIILSQLITYIYFSSLVNCMYYGDCKLSGWLLLIVPILGSLILILSKFSYFDNIKNDLNKIKNILEKLEIKN